MGLINGSLQIGRSALMTQQSMMQIIGNNISNAGNPDYSRQTGRLAPVYGSRLPEGFDPGSGVRLVSLKRHVDNSIEQRLREAISDNNYDDLTSQVLSRLETLYNEMTDNDVSSGLSEFFNVFSELQSKPQDIAARSVTVQTAQALVEQIQTLRYDIVNVYNDLQTKMSDTVDQINRITSQIAQINGQIAQTTSAGGNAGALLDERDAHLRELSELVNVHSIEQESGIVTVFIGSDPIVQNNEARQLEVEKDTSDNGLILPKVVFSDTGKEIQAFSGTTGSVVDLINDFVGGNIEELDNLASALIFEVNKIHSSGQGLHGYKSVTSTYAVEDAGAELDEAGLPFTPENGTFLINVKDLNTNQISTHQINVDLNGVGSDMSVNDIIAQINAIDNVSASVLGDGRIEIKTDSDNYEITFAEDTSGFLAAIGINNFFVGKNAFDIDVRSEIVDDPQLIAAAKENLPGDGSNAGDIAQLRTNGVDSLNGLSISDKYRSIVSDLGTKTAGARQRQEVHQAIVDTLTAQRESVSGVNIDEETVNLLSTQRAFQGAARYISAVDEMIQEILGLF